MKIIVSIKPVTEMSAETPPEAALTLGADRNVMINPFDEVALEEALRLSERLGGEVVVITVGPLRALDTLRDALALGADRGVLVVRETPVADSGLVAKALYAVIAREPAPDLILMGKQAVDMEQMQTHYRLAALLNLPVVSAVTALELKDSQVTATCEPEGGAAVVYRLALPCVIGAARGLNTPRYRSLPGILKARTKPVTQIDWEDLDLDAMEACQLEGLDPVSHTRHATIATGEIRDAADQIAERIAAERRSP
jgi:electron transfer flavoprotein beta subunit